MSNHLSVYSRLFGQLADLIPDLKHVAIGSSFCIPPRIDDDIAIYCEIVAVDGDLALIDLAYDRQRGVTAMIAHAIRLRVDFQTQQAEVLELEDTHSHQVVYSDGLAHPRREQINLFVCNWFQVMISLAKSFQPVDVAVTH